MKDELNFMWLQAITSEMALNYNTGLINRQGSPFTQFRRLYPECPRNKKKALLWAKDFLEKNDVLATQYFLNTVKAIEDERPDKE